MKILQPYSNLIDFDELLKAEHSMLLYPRNYIFSIVHISYTTITENFYKFAIPSKYSFDLLLTNPLIF